MSDAPERRRPSILLIVSLCLNLVFVGLGATMFLRGPSPHERGGLSAQGLARLVPAERDKIEAVIAAHHARLQDLHRQAARARHELFAVLGSKDFDKASFEKAMLAVQTADAAYEAENLKTTADAVALLTPQERDSVAGEFHRPGHSWFRRMFKGR